MNSFECDECGCACGSHNDLKDHRDRTHPRTETDIESDIHDQWIFLRACRKDNQWLWLIMTLDHHIDTLIEWKKAIERRLL